MRSWTDALYDTCSLAALGRALIDDEAAAAELGPVWGIEESLSPAVMRPTTAARLREMIRLCSLPPLKELKRILARAAIPAAVAEVDRLTYAAAVHHHHRVVTADKNLARLLMRAKLSVVQPVVVPGFIEVGPFARAAST